MKRKYSDQEMRRIMKKELEIPPVVEERIKSAYEQIEVPAATSMKKYKRHKRFLILAAVLVVACVGVLAGFAANGYFQKTVSKEGEKLSYHFEIDYELTPYDVEVSPGYLPDGYELKGPDSPYGGKIHNDETGKGITMLPYNLASLDEFRDNDMLTFDHVKSVEELTVQNMEAHLITTESKLDGEGKSLFIFNQKDGYVIQLWTDGGISDDDLKKTADTMKIHVLDTQVAYRTEEEKKAEAEELESVRQRDEEIYAAGIQAENVHQIGEEVHNPMVESLTDEPDEYGLTLDSLGDVRYTVEDVKVLDSLPASEYPQEYYRDYEKEVAPVLKEDGTLKPYERAKFDVDTRGLGMGEEEIETVNSKFLVVRMKLRNMRSVETPSEEDIAPVLTHLIKREDGDYDYPRTEFRPVDYDTDHIRSRFVMNGVGAFYFDAPYFTEGIDRLKDFTFVKLEANQELEYTLVYAVDEDELKDMCLQFYYGYSDEKQRPYQCYVKIS